MLQANYCTVKQNMGVISEDAPGDSDRLPDFTKINGKVTFVPTTASGQAYQLFDEEGSAYTVPIASIEADIINGKIFHEGQEGVPLFAAGKNANPEKIVYRVTYSGLRAGRIPVSLNAIYFEAVPGAVIDLTAVTPVPGAPVAGTIKGDKGDKGDTGPKGATGARGATGAKGDKGDKGDPGEVTLEQLNQAIRVDTSVGTRVFAGDVMIYGDTGTRGLVEWDSEGVVTYGEMPVGLEPTSGVRGGIYIRRINEDVTVSLIGVSATNVAPIIPVPDGFAVTYAPFPMITMNPVRSKMTISAKVGRGYLYLTGAIVGDRLGDSGPSYAATMTWKATDSWPKSPTGADPS